MVEDIFDELRKNYKECDGRLDVIIDSGDVFFLYFCVKILILLRKKLTHSI